MNLAYFQGAFAVSFRVSEHPRWKNSRSIPHLSEASGDDEVEEVGRLGAERKKIPWSSKSSIWNASKLEKTHVEKATTWSFWICFFRLV